MEIRVLQRQNKQGMYRVRDLWRPSSTLGKWPDGQAIGGLWKVLCLDGMRKGSELVRREAGRRLTSR